MVWYSRLSPTKSSLFALLDNSIHRTASSFLRLKVAVWGREEAVIGRRTLFSEPTPGSNRHRMVRFLKG
jgi:hypothetical protein